MYECIIFDVDGTLIDTERVIVLALQRLLARRGREIDRAELQFVLGIPGDLSLRQLGVTDRYQALQEWNQNIQTLAGEIRLFDGIRPLIQQLDQQDVLKGIVTSKTREELTMDFGPFGLMSSFPFSVCVDEVTYHKPHPEPLLRCLEMASVAPADALYIGDTIYDSECARESGVDFALALWGARPGSSIPASLELTHPCDLLNVADRMNRRIR